MSKPELTLPHVCTDEGSRTPYLHAHTQLLLGNICDVE